jgi:hypothetical protein
MYSTSNKLLCACEKVWAKLCSKTPHGVSAVPQWEGGHFQHLIITVLYIYCNFHSNLYPTSNRFTGTFVLPVHGYITIYTSVQLVYFPPIVEPYQTNRPA